MFKKLFLLTVFSLTLVALPLTASAAELLCSSSIQFDPEEVSLNREDPTLVPVLMTYMAEGDFEMCDYTISLYDPDGNAIGKNIETESIIDLENGSFKIDFTKNDFLEKEMRNNGEYTLEITSDEDNTTKGILTFNLTSGEVLGVFHERGGSYLYYILAAIAVIAGGAGVYMAKKR